MKKTILFDLDGTLVDSGPGITKCAQYALDHFGIHEPETEKLAFFVGPPLLNTFMEHYGFSEEQAKEILLEPEIFILIDLGQGSGCATAWGCDLTYDYVKINGDYRT